ncbi:MAG: rod shape-determining protein RodA [Proteobacteria bacterium]|nr:rod shape-determining protein RodA [Pseudomonadota bacterium]
MTGKKTIQNVEWGILAVVLILAAVGLINLHSAVARPGNGFFTGIVNRQLVWFCLGFATLTGAAFIRYQLLDRWAWAVWALGVVLLVGVLFFGRTISGSTRWIIAGPVRIQPSEFVKLAVIVALARVYGRTAEEGGLTLAELLRPFFLVAVPAGLILVQPDLGTAMLVGLIAGSMTLFAGIRRKDLLGLATACALLVPIAWMNLKDYQKKRIFTFLDPDSDPLGAGYHIIQSKIAIGSGMVTGKGYMAGTQKALAFLPEQHTDFIFSVLAEEWGFLGGVFLLALFLALFAMGMGAAWRSRDSFGTFLAVGVVSMIFWQVLINVGMVMGLLPVVGVPLPFISYGGSSVLTTFLGVGLLLNVGMRRMLFE